MPLSQGLGVYDVKHIDLHEENVSCRMSAVALRCLQKSGHHQAKSRLLYDGIQAGMIKLHQGKPIDMVIDRFMKLVLSPDHHQLTGS